MKAAGLVESLHSARNRLFWHLRSRLRWQRPGYKESGAESLNLSGSASEAELRYELNKYRYCLSETTYCKNLWTVLLLERFLEKHLDARKPLPEILEPGSQDFSRLPALRAFFRKRALQPRVTALELDPFPVLHDFHSRWDKAKYYLNCVAKAAPSADRYIEKDFFHWSEPVNLICCFYPFVSPHPALAWGLPAAYGNGKPWVDGFVRNLSAGGLLLVVHQGEWEQSDFDVARAGSPLRLLERGEFSCDFYPLPYPACVSLYRREL